MGPTWVLLAPDGPHVGPMNLAIRGIELLTLWGVDDWAITSSDYSFEESIPNPKGWPFTLKTEGSRCQLCNPWRQPKFFVHDNLQCHQEHIPYQIYTWFCCALFFIVSLLWICVVHLPILFRFSWLISLAQGNDYPRAMDVNWPVANHEHNWVQTVHQYKDVVLPE